MIPFESMEAKMFNQSVQTNSKQSIQASKELVEIFMETRNVERLWFEKHYNG